ncbi:MAG TPA: hypothetical protein VGE93_26605, partial [Bryobacteraceae bacterium]
MRGRHTSFLARIGVLVGILVPLLGAQTAGRHAGAAVQTLDLVAQPDADDLTNARKAFRDGDIVRIAGGKPQDLQRLLGIGGAILTRSTVPGNGAPNASLPQNDTAFLYQIVAARATATGALHEFQQLGTDIIGAANGGTSTAYEAWAEKEAQLAQAEESGSLPTDPKPPSTKLWTELQQSTFRNTDAQGNIFQNTISIYRLNDTSPSNDWYMILTDPQSQPNYTGCGVFGTGSCGWWTDQRVFTMSTVPQAILFNHGPLNTISSSTAQFMIGGNINGVNAAYSVSWQQPSVTTTDQSDLANGTGKWTEDFQGQGSFGSTPPTTSTGLFVSHQGSIFQVPEGTTSFQFTLNEPVTSEFQPHFGEPYTWTSNYNVQINIFPPVFLTSLNNLSIPPGGSGSFEITAVNPSTSNSSLGLAWEVTNLPSWLTVSQTSGSSSARLTLNVAPGTALGTVGSLNVNTNPASAAPSVENKPLLVRVTVGQPNDTGIMLAGGSDAQGRIQDVADLYSPQLGQFDFESTMQSPRRDHSATLLLSGKLLIAGGSTMPRTATASAELFDPEAAQFSATAGMMTDSRSMHTASLLPNGKVLLAGGVDTASLNGSGDSLATAELYDPDTETFTATGSMTAMRVLHSSTSLLDGTILIAGGQPNWPLASTLNTAEIYDPGTGRFAATTG